MMIIEDFKLIDLVYQLNFKFFIFFTSFIFLLIDLNRIPFDWIEGEWELISQFNLEYYRRLFIYIFLSE